MGSPQVDIGTMYFVHRVFFVMEILFARLRLQGEAVPRHYLVRTSLNLPHGCMQQSRLGEWISYRP